MTVQELISALQSLDVPGDTQIKFGIDEWQFGNEVLDIVGTPKVIVGAEQKPIVALGDVSAVEYEERIKLSHALRSQSPPEPPIDMKAFMDIATKLRLAMPRMNARITGF